MRFSQGFHKARPVQPAENALSPLRQPRHTTPHPPPAVQSLFASCRDFANHAGLRSQSPRVMRPRAHTRETAGHTARDCPHAAPTSANFCLFTLCLFQCVPLRAHPELWIVGGIRSECVSKLTIRTNDEQTDRVRLYPWIESDCHSKKLDTYKE